MATLNSDRTSKFNNSMMATRFFVSFVFDGLQRLSGIFFFTIVETYYVTRQSAVMPFALSRVVTNIVGPVSKVLFRERKSTSAVLSGTVLPALGVGLCLLSTNITRLTIFWGLIFGLGCGIACPHMLCEMKDNNKQTSSSLYQSSPYLGMVVQLLLFEIIVPSYGINGFYIIISGIMLHSIPLSLAAIYKIHLPLPKINWRVRKRSNRYMMSKKENENYASFKHKVVKEVLEESFGNSFEPDEIGETPSSIILHNGQCKRNADVVTVESEIKILGETNFNRGSYTKTEANDLSVSKEGDLRKHILSTPEVIKYERERNMYEGSFTQDGSNSTVGSTENYESDKETNRINLIQKNDKKLTETNFIEPHQDESSSTVESTEIYESEEEEPDRISITQKKIQKPIETDLDESRQGESSSTVKNAVNYESEDKESDRVILIQKSFEKPTEIRQGESNSTVESTENYESEDEEPNRTGLTQKTVHKSIETNFDEPGQGDSSCRIENTENCKKVPKELNRIHLVPKKVQKLSQANVNVPRPDEASSTVESIENYKSNDEEPNIINLLQKNVQETDLYDTEHGQSSNTGKYTENCVPENKEPNMISLFQNNAQKPSKINLIETLQEGSNRAIEITQNYESKETKSIKLTQTNVPKPSKANLSESDFVVVDLTDSEKRENIDIISDPFVSPLASKESINPPQIYINDIRDSFPLGIKVHVVECTFESKEQYLCEYLSTQTNLHKRNSYRKHSNSLPSGCYNAVDLVTSSYMEHNWDSLKSNGHCLKNISKMHSISEESVEGKKNENYALQSTDSSSSSLLKAKQSLKVLKPLIEPTCLFIIFISAIYEFILMTLLTIFADLAMNAQAHHSEFKWILLAFGVGGICGKIAFSYIGAQVLERAHATGALIFLLNGMVIAGILWSTNLGWLVGFYAALGALESGLLVTVLKLLTDYTVKHAEPLLSSACSCMSGIAVLIMPSAIGLSRDETGDYDDLLQVMSCASVMCAILCYFIPRLPRTSQRNIDAQEETPNV